MKFRKGIGLILLTAVLLGSCEVLGIGGDDSGEDNKLPKLVWTKKEVGRSAAPLVDDDFAYLLGFDELVKLNPETGEESWRTSNGDVWKPSLRLPFIQSESQLFAHFGESIRAWNKTDGSIAWSFPTGIDGPFVQADSLVAEFSEIAQSSDRLFVGIKNEVAAISKADGTVDYRIVLDELVPENVWQKTLNPVVSSGPDPVLYVPTTFKENSTRGNLFSYDAKTGEPLFAFKIHDLLEDTVPTPDFILDIGISGDKLILLLNNYSLVAVNRFTGKLLWSAEATFTTSLLVAGGGIYTNGTFGVQYFDANNGQLIWEVEEENLSLSTQIIFKKNRLYRHLSNFSSSRVQVLDAKDGEVLQTINPSDVSGLESYFPFLYSIAVYDNYLISQSDLDTYGIKIFKK